MHVKFNLTPPCFSEVVLFVREVVPSFPKSCPLDVLEKDLLHELFLVEGPFSEEMVFCYRLFTPFYYEAVDQSTL
jgi:hypothetical protein